MTASASSRRARLGASVALAALMLAFPVQGQEGPTSILPEGMFDAPPPSAPSDPAPPAPAPAPLPAPQPGPGAPRAPAPGTPAAVPPVTAAVPGPPVLQLPPVTSRPIDQAGILSVRQGGYGPGVFAGSNPRFLTTLMRRLDAPVASRWVHIVLRRALLSRVPAPPGVQPANWIGERAALLLRMGEADGAKALVDQVPVDRFTPRLYGVAGSTHLAAADLPALCPLHLTGASLSSSPSWRLASAMCAAFEGDDLAATETFESMREADRVTPFDISLAERIASSAGAGVQTANIEWAEADKLDLYRIGLASAAGAEIPERFLEQLPSPALGWLFRAPGTPETTRAAVAPAAAAQGIVSTSELAALYAALADDPDSTGAGQGIADRLRLAYTGEPADRVAALRALWDGRGYQGRVLAAGAAARLAPDTRFAPYAPDIMASALAAGRSSAALRWWPIAQNAGGEVAHLAWPLAAAADEGRRVDVSPQRFQDWLERELERDEEGGLHRARLFYAALEGLGRAGGTTWSGIRRRLEIESLDNNWTRAIEEAAGERRRGEVAILAATGMQSGWDAVPPQHLLRIIRAYRAVGLSGEAHMLAAEAVSRA